MSQLQVAQVQAAQDALIVPFAALAQRRARRASLGRSPVAPAEGRVLLFTGIRYERQDPASGDGLLETASKSACES